MDSVAEFDDVGSGVKDGTGDESVGEAGLEPDEVFGVGWSAQPMP